MKLQNNLKEIIMKKLISFCFCMFVVFFVSSCSEMERKKFEELFKAELPEPKRIVTINSIVKYPRAKELEKEIMTFTGRKVWINTNSFIHSKAIKDIELVPRDPEGHYYDLKLKLSSHGKLVWLQLSAGFAYEKMGFVVDGLFYRSFLPKPMKKNDDFVVIEGPFDKYTAQEIKQYAKSNFEYFNQQ
jgi:hypothetical protein